MELTEALSTIPEVITEPSDILLNGGTEPAKEPTQADLAAELDTELDDLLAESLTIKNQKTSRGAVAGVKKALFEREQNVPWTILQYIRVWTRTTCECGCEGAVTYVRDMRQMKKSGITHWETVASIPQEEKFTDALIERSSKMCEDCGHFSGFIMKSFSEVTGA